MTPLALAVYVGNKGTFFVYFATNWYFTLYKKYVKYDQISIFSKQGIVILKIKVTILKSS